MLFSRALAQQQGSDSGFAYPLVHPRRSARHGDWDQRRVAGTLVKRNPYPGKLGVVEQGALADLILVDGNPLENINLVADPDQSFLVIMKDGRAYKNTVPK